MDRENIESSMMIGIGYERESSALEIEFKNGTVWQYFDFPEALWYEFKDSDSKGKFFHKEIRGQFSESRV